MKSHILPYSKFEFFWERYTQEIKNRLQLKKFEKWFIFLISISTKIELPQGS